VNTLRYTEQWVIVVYLEKQGLFLDSEEGLNDKK